MSLLVLAGLAVGISSSPAAASSASEAAEAQFFALLNAARQAEGRAPLTSDPALVNIARGWSAHMVEVHARTGDPVIKPEAPTDCEVSAVCHRSDLATVVGAVAPGWRLIGENLAYGGSIQAMHDGLMRSTHHHENIVGPFDRVGIGVVIEGSSFWVTFDFVQAPAQVSASAPTESVRTASGPADPVVPVGVNARFNALAPARVADTRTGAGVASGMVGAGGVLQIPLSGNSVPVGATGAVVNLTATQPQSAGYLTAYPCGAARPLASNLNVEAGETRANAASVALDGTGMLCVFTSVNTHVVVDIAGWFGSTGAALKAMSPARVFDSRASGGRGTTFTVDVSGSVPADATAVTANLTVTNPAAAGFLTAYPCGSEPPLVSSLNFTAGQTIASLATVKLGAGGRVCLYSPVPTDVIVDLAGAYTSNGGALTAAVPSRFLDTRAGTGGWLGAVGVMQRIELPIGGARGVPSTATAAVINLTATETAAAGYVVVYPCDQPMPNVSNLNFDAGQTAANLATVRLSAGGSLCLAASSRAHLVVDLAGWYGA